MKLLLALALVATVHATSWVAPNKKTCKQMPDTCGCPNGICDHGDITPGPITPPGDDGVCCEAMTLECEMCRCSWDPMFKVNMECSQHNVCAMIQKRDNMCLPGCKCDGDTGGDGDNGNYLQEGEKCKPMMDFSGTDIGIPGAFRRRMTGTMSTTAIGDISRGNVNIDNNNFTFFKGNNNSGDNGDQKKCDMGLECLPSDMNTDGVFPRPIGRRRRLTSMPWNPTDMLSFTCQNPDEMGGGGDCGQYTAPGMCQESAGCMWETPDMPSILFNGDFTKVGGNPSLIGVGGKQGRRLTSMIEMKGRCVEDDGADSGEDQCAMKCMAMGIDIPFRRRLTSMPIDDKNVGMLRKVYECLLDRCEIKMEVNQLECLLTECEQTMAKGMGAMKKCGCQTCGMTCKGETDPDKDMTCHDKCYHKERQMSTQDQYTADQIERFTMKCVNGCENTSPDGECFAQCEKIWDNEKCDAEEMQDTCQEKYDDCMCNQCGVHANCEREPVDDDKMKCMNKCGNTMDADNMDPMAYDKCMCKKCGDESFCYDDHECECPMIDHFDKMMCGAGEEVVEEAYKHMCMDGITTKKCMDIRCGGGCHEKCNIHYEDMDWSLDADAMDEQQMKMDMCNCKCDNQMAEADNAMMGGFAGSAMYTRDCAREHEAQGCMRKCDKLFMNYDWNMDDDMNMDGFWPRRRRMTKMAWPIDDNNTPPMPGGEDMMAHEKCMGECRVLETTEECGKCVRMENKQMMKNMYPTDQMMDDPMSYCMAEIDQCFCDCNDEMRCYDPERTLAQRKRDCMGEGDPTLCECADMGFHECADGSVAEQYEEEMFPGCSCPMFECKEETMCGDHANGDSWHNDCNSCWCEHGSEVCTEMACEGSGTGSGSGDEGSGEVHCPSSLCMCGPDEEEKYWENDDGCSVCECSMSDDACTAGKDYLKNKKLAKTYNKTKKKHTKKFCKALKKCVKKGAFDKCNLKKFDVTKIMQGVEDLQSMLAASRCATAFGANSLNKSQGDTDNLPCKGDDFDCIINGEGCPEKKNKKDKGDKKNKNGGR